MFVAYSRKQFQIVYYFPEDLSDDEDFDVDVSFLFYPLIGYCYQNLTKKCYFAPRKPIKVLFTLKRFWWVEKIAHAECKRLNILSMYESSNATQNEMWITYGNIGTKCCLSSSGLMSPLRMAVTSRAATPKGRRRMFLTFCTFASFSGGNMPPSLTTWHTRKTFSLTLDKSLLPRSYRDIRAILHILCYMVNISQCYSAQFDWYSCN